MVVGSDPHPDLRETDMAIRMFHFDLDAKAYGTDQTWREHALADGAQVEDMSDDARARLATSNRMYDPDRTARAGWVITYTGRVVGLREMNGYDDSDFYATVWDDDAGRPVEIQYGTTRGWTYNNSARYDADDETDAKYEVWKAAREAERLAAWEAAEAFVPYPERRVEVTGGRKHLGKTGRVFWRGEDRYAPNYYGTAKTYRVGVETDGGDKFFIAEDYVTVTDGVPA